MITKSGEKLRNSRIHLYADDMIQYTTALNVAQEHQNILSDFRRTLGPSDHVLVSIHGDKEHSNGFRNYQTSLKIQPGFILNRELTVYFLNIKEEMTYC